MDDAKSSCPLFLWQTTCYNGRDKGWPSYKGKITPKTPHRFRLQAATRVHEAVTTTNRRSTIQWCIYS